jgi:hypothetical protein
MDKKIVSEEFRMPKGVVHCWEDGPLTEDGCPTTCMCADGHFGPHEFIRDDEIIIRFAPRSDPAALMAQVIKLPNRVQSGRAVLDIAKADFEADSINRLVMIAFRPDGTPVLYQHGLTKAEVAYAALLIGEIALEE